MRQKKKTSKVPKAEIDKARGIMRLYFKQKQNNEDYGK